MIAHARPKTPRQCYASHQRSRNTTLSRAAVCRESSALLRRLLNRHDGSPAHALLRAPGTPHAALSMSCTRVTSHGALRHRPARAQLLKHGAMVRDGLFPHQPPCRSGLNLYLKALLIAWSERVDGVGPRRLVQQFQRPENVPKRGRVSSQQMPSPADRAVGRPPPHPCRLRFHRIESPLANVITGGCLLDLRQAENGKKSDTTSSADNAVRYVSSHPVHGRLELDR